MIIRMGVEVEKAKISREGGYYTLSENWEVSQSDGIIALRYRDEGVLKITSEGEVFYNPSSEVILEKEGENIKLIQNQRDQNDLIIKFGGFDVSVILNNKIIEFQSFLEDPFTIELS